MSDGNEPQVAPSRTSPLLLLGIGSLVGAGIVLAVLQIQSSGAEPDPKPSEELALARPSAAAPIPEPLFTVNATPLGGARVAPWGPDDAGAAPAAEGDAGARAAAFERSVQDERALLDAVRYALDKGDGRKAAELLERHDREFADGLFGPDARILRVEALALAGRDAEAVAQASEFLEAFPHSPQADRVRALLSNLRARAPGR